jgi:hypothetical protein
MSNEPQYEVGYGRPPKEGQFKKGQRRRPRQPEKEDHTFHAIVLRMLAKRVRLTENNKPKWITMRDAIVTAQVNAAASKGDPEILDLLSEFSELLDDNGKNFSPIVKFIKNDENK